MAKFTARLTGESDGFVSTRDFRDQANAIAWLRRKGLVDFEDQLARGEVFDEHGKVVWAQSHLQSPEQAERQGRLDAQRFLAKHNVPPRR